MLKRVTCLPFIIKKKLSLHIFFSACNVEIAAAVGQDLYVYGILLQILTYVYVYCLYLQGGIYLFQIMDWYVGAVTLMLVSILECVVLTWVYGHKRLCRDIEMMLGHPPHVWWLVCWSGVSPLMLLVSYHTLLSRRQFS